jgi:hypothetical protein
MPIQDEYPEEYTAALLLTQMLNTMSVIPELQSCAHVLVHFLGNAGTKTPAPNGKVQFEFTVENLALRFARVNKLKGRRK